MSGSASLVSIESIDMPEAAPTYVIVARIGAVLGMSLSLTTALLLLIGGFILPSLISLAMFFPALTIMMFAERRAASDEHE